MLALSAAVLPRSLAFRNEACSDLAGFFIDSPPFRSIAPLKLVWQVFSCSAPPLTRVRGEPEMRQDPVNHRWVLEVSPPRFRTDDVGSRRHRSAACADLGVGAETAQDAVTSRP